VFDPFFKHDKDDDRSIMVHLAERLETLVTSDYNYARFIKEINLDSDDTDTTAWEFEYVNTCGQLINFSIVSLLKKAVSLETFM
jgi:hypothetical protein